jgi:hypothetical protein
MIDIISHRAHNEGIIFLKNAMKAGHDSDNVKIASMAQEYVT